MSSHVHPPVEEQDSATPAYLARVLSSKRLERAPTLRRLLLYLWQHRDEPISEYAIATEALGRNGLFDSKTDATVRVQISRLRQRLEEYYANEGRDSAERLVIPVGTHHLQVEIRPAAPEDPRPEPIPILSPAPLMVSRRPTALIALCALLGVACLGLTIALLLRDSAPIAAAPTWFWKSFFSNGRPTRVVLPTPMFLSWSLPNRDKNATVMFRDTNLNEYADRLQSETIRDLERQYGQGRLSQSYTVTSDTFAAVRLARYLDKSGLETNVLSSANAPLDALERENVIALGTTGTLSPLKFYLDRMNFELTAHEMKVINRKPRAGEKDRYEFAALSSERAVWPGILALLPGRGANTKLLMMASRHTSAMVSFLTSRAGLDQLEAAWRANGSPPYYEALVEAEMNGQDLVRFTGVVLRPYSEPEQPRNSK